jgi:hypothetical protein
MLLLPELLLPELLLLPMLLPMLPLVTLVTPQTSAAPPLSPPYGKRTQIYVSMIIRK